jgi:hypothetical protein
VSSAPTGKPQTLQERIAEAEFARISRDLGMTVDQLKGWDARQQREQLAEDVALEADLAIDKAKASSRR